MTDRLQVLILYRRELPLVEIEAECQRWRCTALQFIDDLEATHQS